MQQERTAPNQRNHLCWYFSSFSSVPLSRRLTAQGNSPSAAALPPTILEVALAADLADEEPLMPHSMDGAGGLHCPRRRHQ